MKIVGLTFNEAPAAPEAMEAAPDVAPIEFTCPVCGKVYKTEDGLENHIKSKHPEAETAAGE